MLADIGPVYPADEDVMANAAAAIDELQRHIDHQSKDAESVDSKAAAILTLTAAAIPLAATRFGAMDTDAKRWAVLIATVAVGALVVSLFQALRPRSVFSYGPNPTTIGRYADRESRKAFALWMLDSYIAARDINVDFLRSKHGWYQRSLRALISSALAVIWMINVGLIE
jgi:hypothetical protein